jgi:hypothetical protein
VLVTFMLSSVWHAILDNFRPITIWGVELWMFYRCATTTSSVTRQTLTSHALHAIHRLLTAIHTPPSPLTLPPSTAPWARRLRRALATWLQPLARRPQRDAHGLRFIPPPTTQRNTMHTH